MINLGEIEFYKKIKDDCSIIFDVGCREDINYIELSQDKTFYLFEPNPIFFENCLTKINSLPNNKNLIHMYNFGLSDMGLDLAYYEDAQSFLKRRIHFQSKSEPIILPVRKFSKFLQENNVEFIDFLKIDVEGYEPRILRDIESFIKNNVKYVQFEYASTWFDNDPQEFLGDIFNLFTNEFDFYFLFNKNHPASSEYKSLITPIINQEIYNTVENYVRNQYGLEIIMRSIDKTNDFD